MLGTTIEDGRLRIIERLVGAFPRGIYRAVDRTTGARFLVAVARLNDDTAAELAAAWPAIPNGARTLTPLADHPGYWTVVEPEGAGVPLTHHLGVRYPLQMSARLVSQVLARVAASGDRRPGRFHPALMRVTGKSSGLTLTSVATRAVELMERAAGEFPAPLWGPTLFAPECLHGGRPASPAAYVFSSAALMRWLVHGVPPFGTTPLEESRRVATNQPLLLPLLAHVDPDVDRGLAMALAPKPEVRPPLAGWTQAVHEIGQATLPELPPPPRNPKFDRSRLLPRATDFLADGADQSRVLLDVVIERLQAGRHAGPMPDRARQDFREVAQAILAGLSTPIGATVNVSFRGVTVPMPGGHATFFKIAEPRFEEVDPSRMPFAPYTLSRIWAVATALGDDTTLDALAAFEPRWVEGDKRDDPHWRFLTCMQARLRGESWHAEAAALVAEPPPPRFRGYASPTPWLEALLRIDPPSGEAPVVFALSETAGVQGALMASMKQHGDYAGDPTNDFVDGTEAEVDWFTLALAAVARARGIPVPLEGVALPRWPAALIGNLSPFDLWWIPRAATLTLERGTPDGPDTGRGHLRIELTGDGQVRAVWRRGRFERGLVGGIGRARARTLVQIPEANIHSVYATRWDTPSVAPADDVILGLHDDGETHLWRLGDAPWMTKLVAEMIAAAEGVTGAATWRARRGAARATPTATEPAGKAPMAGPAAGPMAGLATLTGRMTLHALADQFALLGIASYGAALPQGRIIWKNHEGREVAQAACAALFSWAQNEVLWATELPGFAAAGVPVVPRPAWQAARVGGIDLDEAADLAAAAARPDAEFVYRAATPGGFLYLEIGTFRPISA